MGITEFVTNPTGCRVINSKVNIRGVDGCLIQLRVDRLHTEVFLSYTDINMEIAALTAIKAEIDATKNWWKEECFRASGEVICSICGNLYRKHPQVAKEEAPTLVRACDGRLLKL